MIFEGAKIYGMNPKGGQPMINVQQHGKRTAAVNDLIVAEIKKER